MEWINDHPERLDLKIMSLSICLSVLLWNRDRISVRVVETHRTSRTTLNFRGNFSFQKKYPTSIPKFKRK